MSLGRSNSFAARTAVRLIPALLATLALLLGACQPAPPALQGQAGTPRVLATDTYLADIAQNVAGDRLLVASLLPIGVDPHSYEPAPGDVTKVAQSTVLIENGAGLDTYLERLLQNAGGQRLEIIASQGLTGRTAREGEAVEQAAAGPEPAQDPHFWLDPNNVITYVKNIRDGLSKADPAGASTYAANAEAYIQKLHDLDGWIAGQVKQIPPDQRQMVTNHEALGYFADRYGLKVVGTVIPSVSTDASPSAQQLARLIDQIKATHAKAIFLESGTNAQLAQQVGQDTGAKVLTDLYTHSITGPDGPAPTYIEMMKHDTQVIVDALK